MHRYFHATSRKKARAILAQGFDHRNPVMGRDDSEVDRFRNSNSGWDNWYNYYHFFLPEFDRETQLELKSVLHDERIPERERGKFMRDIWSDRFGENWTMIWLGRDEVFLDYGPAVLEFRPGPGDRVFDDLEYWVVLHLERKIPASQFRLLGELPPELKSELEDRGDAVSIELVEELLEESR